MFKFLGLPSSLSFYKKFLVANPDRRLISLLQKELELKVHNFKISDVIFFTNGNNEVTYYRKRKTGNVKTFIRCEKWIKGGKYREKRRNVNYREYLSMRELKTQGKYVIKKIRDCFMYNKIFYNVDTLTIQDMTFSIVVIQGYKEKQNLTLPEVIKKNIVGEIPKNQVDIYSEILAKDKGKVFTKELKEKLRFFKE